MSIYQKVNQTKIVKTLFCIHFPEGCLSLTASMVKRCMHFLRQLKIVGISQNILKLFYYGVKENILTFSITVVWLRPLEEKAQLETLVKCASKIIGLTLPTIESVYRQYHTRYKRKLKNIVRDVTHPANHLFNCSCQANASDASF